jgi:hypothetical protein
MNLFGKEPQEKSMQRLIHDTNRDIFALDHVLSNDRRVQKRLRIL